MINSIMWNMIINELTMSPASAEACNQGKVYSKWPVVGGSTSTTTSKKSVAVGASGRRGFVRRWSWGDFLPGKVEMED
ncbi:hypothetical protein QQP08_013254 [Theobroma cacao]|nr:hypothetical protein QQP08_013254 [Theobroma cacao]